MRFGFGGLSGRCDIGMMGSVGMRDIGRGDSGMQGLWGMGIIGFWDDWGWGLAFEQMGIVFWG